MSAGKTHCRLTGRRLPSDSLERRPDRPAENGKGWTDVTGWPRPPLGARVSSYDALGTVMAMPVGALIAGPLGNKIGISSAQYAAAAAIVASALALIPRDIRTMPRADAAIPPAAEGVEAELEAVPG
jgi:hypothetical protein